MKGPVSGRAGRGRTSPGGICLNTNPLGTRSLSFFNKRLVFRSREIIKPFSRAREIQPTRFPGVLFLPAAEADSDTRPDHAEKTNLAPRQSSKTPSQSCEG